ncbi:hypothetical protein [Anoxybacillus sp. J5B_2022]|uniref:hypothetical protein n=1 Tax=Anoxybacillus sp. J5B_2022 TaxID=3003246 RepID=UPI002285BCBE|nr:hypothetical protein [Anoxybacillus sp. J5B_2022]MCZ0756730.1 hypothetical protein [Anoxybacillus sp. J5B_2022]
MSKSIILNYGSTTTSETSVNLLRVVPTHPASVNRREEGGTAQHTERKQGVAGNEEKETNGVESGVRISPGT